MTEEFVKLCRSNEEYMLWSTDVCCQPVCKRRETELLEDRRNVFFFLINLNNMDMSTRLLHAGGVVEDAPTATATPTLVAVRSVTVTKLRDEAVDEAGRTVIGLKVDDMFLSIKDVADFPLEFLMKHFQYGRVTQSAPCCISILSLQFPNTQLQASIVEQRSIRAMTQIMVGAFSQILYVLFFMGHDMDLCLGHCHTSVCGEGCSFQRELSVFQFVSEYMHLRFCRHFSASFMYAPATKH